MEPKTTFDRWLGLFFIAFALVTIFIWIPADTGSGIAEKVRRKFVIGDALGPTVAAVIILLGGVLAWLRPNSDDKSIGTDHLIWFAKLMALFLISLTVMRYLGPIAGNLVEGGYRPLRATVPWKYIGYLVGGTGLVLGLNAYVQRKITWRDFSIALVAVLAIALAYDLPFDDLILPPNGDV